MKPGLQKARWPVLLMVAIAFCASPVMGQGLFDDIPLSSFGRFNPSLLILPPERAVPEPPTWAVATLTGQAAVKDGDGLLFGDVEIRLQGIAAPELGDPGGPIATQALIQLVAGRDVWCFLDGTRAGPSQRPVAVCYVRRDGFIDVGAELVRTGFARDCPGYSGGRYQDAEAEARAMGRDLSATYPLPDYC